MCVRYELHFGIKCATGKIIKSVEYRKSARRVLIGIKRNRSSVAGH